MKADRQSKNETTPNRTSRRSPARERTHSWTADRDGDADSVAHEFDDHPLFDLQRRAGNRAVGQLLEHSVQAKLRIGPPNDRYEREADRVARTVTRLPRSWSGGEGAAGSDEGAAGTTNTATPRIQRLCTRCRGRLQRGLPLDCPDCERRIQRSEASSGERLPAVPDTVAGEITRSSGAGRPLPAPTRSFFESRFGQDFGDVRVHDGGRAAQLNRALDARAFTYGRDVFFGANQYRPESEGGKRLLAHELTHVVQQEQGDASYVQRQTEPELLWTSVDFSSANAQEIEAEIHRLRRWLDENQGHPEASRMSERIRQLEILIQERVSSPNVQERLELIRAHLDNPWNFGWQSYIRYVPWVIVPGWSALQQGVSESPEEALKRLWGGFGDDLLWIAGEEPALSLWRRSVEEGAPLSELPQLQPFLEMFEQAAIRETREVLEEGRYRVEAEARRYGIQSHLIPPGPPMLRNRTGPLRVASMAENTDTPGLRSAARDLAEVQSQMYSHRWTIEQYREEGLEATGNYFEREQEIQNLLPLYASLRNRFTSEYPILADYTDDYEVYEDDLDAFRNDVEALRRIANDSSAGAAAVLYETIRNRRRDITTVLRELDNLEQGRETNLSVWTVERIRELTRARLGINEGTLQAAMVASKVQDVETDEQMQELLLSGLALGLGLIAAIPSGGSSLVATATFIAGTSSFAIGAYQARETVEDYRLESALAGTTFERAQALARGEPEFFWVAFEVASVVLEGADVLRGVFRVVRRLKAAGHANISGDDIINELGEGLTINRATASELAGRLSADEGTGVAGEVTEAVGRQRRAVREARGELGNVVDELPEGMKTVAENSGHTVAILPNGRLVFCTLCTWIRGGYAQVLADPENAILNDLVTALENRAQRVAHASSPAARDVLSDAAELVDWLDLASRRGGLSQGAREALERGWRPPPRGYHWRRGVDEPIVVGPADQRLRYNAERRTFEPIPDTMTEMVGEPNVTIDWVSQGTTLSQRVNPSSVPHIRPTEREILEQLSEENWNRVLEYARTNRNIFSVKGKLAEELIELTPEFSGIMQRVRQQAAEELGESVRIQFIRDVQEVEHTGAFTELTDGIIAAIHDGNVRIFAVFESKSPSNVRDLAMSSRQASGQVGWDFDRFRQGPIRINGEVFQPDRVQIGLNQSSRYPTEWLGVVPPGSSLSGRALGWIRGSMRDFRQISGPIRNEILNEVARRILALSMQ